MTKREPDAWTTPGAEHRDRLVVTGWSLLLAVAFLWADAAVDRAWVDGVAMVVALTIGVAGVGLGWIWSYARFLRHTDELMRKIQLDAMAVALGTGFVVGFCLTVLDGGGLLHAQPSHILVTMVAGYVGTVAISLVRFGGDGS